MNCKKCGAQLSPEDKFCKNCGAVVEHDNTITPQNMNVGDSLPQQNTINTPNPNKTINFKNGNLIIGVVVIVVLVALAVIFVPKYFESTKKDNNVENSNTEPSTTPTPSPVSSKSYYKVNFENFTFNIPDDMVYEIDSDELVISDEAGTWMSEIFVMQGSFDQIKSNKSTLQSYFQNVGFIAKPAEVKSISGTEFVTVELSASGISGIGAYTKLNSMYSLWTVTYNQDNDYDYNILSNIASISSTATYNSMSNSIKPENKFDFNIDEITGFAQ